MAGTVEDGPTLVTDAGGEWNLAAVTLKDVDRYMGRLALDGLAPNTRRGRMAALKSLFAFLTSRGFVAANPLKLARPPEEKRLDRIPIFSTAEIERLIWTPVPILPRQRREPMGHFVRRSRIHELKELRDTALLAVAYSCALRASEPGKLLRTDYRLESDRFPILVLRESKWSGSRRRFTLTQRSRSFSTPSFSLAIGRASSTPPSSLPWPLGESPATVG